MENKGLVARIKRAIKVFIDKLLRRVENPLDLMRIALEEAKQVIVEIDEAIAKLQAQGRMGQQDIEKYEAEISKYQRVLDAAVAQNDERTGANALVAVKQYERHVQGLKSHVEGLKQSERNLEDQLAIFKGKYQSQVREFKIMESESQYTDVMGKINNQLRDNFNKDELSGFQALARELREKSAFEQARNGRLLANDEDALEHQSAVAEFHAYKASKAPAPAGE